MDDRLRRSRRQERRIADENGGTVNSQSGAGWIRKNDVRTPTESWELKTTTKQQFTLKLADLLTAWTHSIIDNRRMVFGIEFGNGEEFVVLRQDDYTGLRDSQAEQYQRAECLAKDYRALLAQMVAGLATVEHDMAMVAGIPQCRCGRPFADGKASESFITHALGILALLGRAGA